MAAAKEFEVSVESSAGLERKLKIRVPSADIEREIASRLAQVGKTAKLKGFRPGKIPEKVVRKYYGGQVRDEVLSDVIRSSYSQAIADQKLNPAGGPRIEAVPGETPADQEHFTYRATFEVYPEITLQPLEQLALEVPRVALDDADVEAMIEKLRTQRATWRAGRACRRPRGDRAVVDFEGKIDGETVSGRQRQRRGRSCSAAGRCSRSSTGRCTARRRARPGRRRCTFPANYPTTDLAGKNAEFVITVQRVEEQVLPELDDTFAASFGVTTGKVEDLAAEVRKNMQRELAERLSRDDQSPRVRRADQGELDQRSARARRAGHRCAAAGCDARARSQRSRPRRPSRERFESLAQRRVTVGLLIQELVKSKQDPARRRARRAARARARGAVREARRGGTVLPRATVA